MIIENIRNFYRRHPTLAAGLSGVPIVLALVLYIYNQPDTGAPDWPLAEYVDEETGERSLRPADELPPLPGKSGKPTVVRAIYLTPSTFDKRFVAFYEKLTDEAKTLIRQHKNESAGLIRMSNDVAHTGTLIRRPTEGSPWVKVNTPEGAALLKQIYTPDPGQPPLRLCPPEQN